MASRRARRSSILKARYDGGSEELNDNNGEEGGTTRNLMGLSRRRVSFSQTNQVKEFEKSNSSTEDASLSKTTTTESNQTVCDFNMSVYVDDASNEQNHQKENEIRDDADKTRVEIGDISVYQTLPNVKGSKSSIDLSVTNRELDTSTMIDGMSKTTCDYNMSIYEDGLIYEGNQTRDDANKTRVGAADISVYQTFPTSNASNYSVDHLAKDREVVKPNSPIKDAMSKTTYDYSMSVYVEEEDGDSNMNPGSNQTSDDTNKTRVGAADISVYQTSPTTLKSTVDHSATDREINKHNSTLKEAMSKTTCNYSMSIYAEDDYEDTETREDINKTRVGAADISVYQSLPKPPKSDTVLSVTNARKIMPDTTCKDSMTANVEDDENGHVECNQNSEDDNSKLSGTTRQITAHEGMKRVRTHLVFGPTDPQQFRNPFGQGKYTAIKRRAIQKEQVPQLSFGKFGCAKSPKRKKMSNDVVPETVIVKKPILTKSSVSAQTSVSMTKDPQENTSSNIPRVAAKSVVDVETSSTLQDRQDVRGNNPLLKKPFIQDKKIPTSPLVGNESIPNTEIVNQATCQTEFMLQADEMKAPSRLPVIPAHSAAVDETVLCNYSEIEVARPTPPVAQGESKTVKGVNILKTIFKRRNILQTPPLEPIQADTAEWFQTTRRESLSENIYNTVTPLTIEQSQEQSAVASSSPMHEDISIFQPESQAVSLDNQSVHRMQPLEIEKLVITQTSCSPKMCDVPPKTEIINQSKIQTVESERDSRCSSLTQAVVVDQPEMESMDDIIPDLAPQCIQTSPFEMENLSTPDPESECVMQVAVSKHSRQEPVGLKTVAVNASDNSVTTLSVVVPKTYLAEKAPKNATFKPSSHSEAILRNRIPLALESPSATTGSFPPRARAKLPNGQVFRTMKETHSANSHSSNFSEIKRKLEAYATDLSLGIFEKWGFLDKAHDKLARITEDEWAIILKTEGIREFLGDEFIKAVNIERQRLNDPHPLYQAAMKSVARNKVKNLI